MIKTRPRTPIEATSHRPIIKPQRLRSLTLTQPLRQATRSSDFMRREPPPPLQLDDGPMPAFSSPERRSEHSRGLDRTAANIDPDASALQQGGSTNTSVPGLKSASRCKSRRLLRTAQVVCSSSSVCEFSSSPPARTQPTQTGPSDLRHTSRSTLGFVRQSARRHRYTRCSTNKATNQRARCSKFKKLHKSIFAKHLPRHASTAVEAEATQRNFRHSGILPTRAETER